MANQHLVERNHDIVAYPSWAELPAVTMREWAIFFGQNITASEMVVPPLSITGEFPEHVPDGIPASFHAEGRVCPDICNRQRCRRHHCECIHPDFIDFSWVPLNSPCRNFFRGHCPRVHCENVHGNTFAEAVYSSYLQHTNQRPRIILHYIQAAKRFEVVTRQAGSNMLLGSMSTGDIMAAKAFVFGMSWTQWATAAEYQQYINAGGPPVADTRVTRGGTGRNTGRGRSPSARRGYASRPATPTRTSSPTPTLSGPRVTTTTSASSGSTSAPSFGRGDTEQPAAKAPPPPFVPAKFPPTSTRHTTSSHDHHHPGQRHR